MMIEMRMHFGRYCCEIGCYYSGDAEPALEWASDESGFGLDVWKFALSFIGWTTAAAGSSEAGL